MFHNITATDKIIRLILGAFALYAGAVHHPLFALAALALLASAATGSCLVYKLLGINRDLETTNRYLSLLPRYNPEPVLLFCDQGKVLFRNRAAETLLGELQAYGQLQSEPSAAECIAKALEQSVRYDSGAKTYQMMLRGNPQERFVMVYGFDITQIVEGEAALRHLALFDPLTGLANRKHLMLDLPNAQNATLTLVDIKKFGQINGFYGHEVGDRLLQAFAQMLRTLEHHDIAPYRLQGDVFALLGSDLGAIKALFAQGTLEVDTLSFALEVSMGHALHVSPGHTLLDLAETALIEAKKRGLASLCYEELGDIAARYGHNLHWSKRIREILSQEASPALVAYFQPIVNAQTYDIEKYETLARVIDNGAPVAPALFLEPAKQLGVLAQITMAMLDAIVVQAQQSHCAFSLNITTQDLRQERFGALLLERLAAAQIAPSRIVLEILEDEEVYEHLGVLQALKAEGFKLAIDDFGTGYSNFAKLQQIEADYIKIDGSLIREVASNAQHLEVIRTINRYAHSIGAKTIAEFVENETIAALLASEQIDYLQGYAFGKPEAQLI